MPQMMNKKTRKIKIRCRPPVVTTETIKKVLSMWKFNVPLRRISKKINPSRTQGDYLAIMDVYGILKVAFDQSQIKQRQGPPEELSLMQFVELYQAWSGGLTMPQIREIIVHRSAHKRAFVNTVLSALNRRYREEKVEREPPLLSGEMTRAETDILKHVFHKADHVLTYGQRMRVAGSDAIVIFINDLPSGLRAIARSVKNKDLQDPQLLDPVEPDDEKDTGSVSDEETNIRISDIARMSRAGKAGRSPQGARPGRPPIFTSKPQVQNTDKASETPEDVEKTAFGAALQEDNEETRSSVDTGYRKNL